MTLTRRTLAYAVVVLASAALAAPLLTTLFHFARAHDSASHVLVVPVVALALIYHRRKAVFQDVSFAPRSGLALILVGAALLFGAKSAWHSPSDPLFRLAVAALVTLNLGGFVLFHGWTAARSARFGLMFLLFLIPFPVVLLNGATEMLKIGSTEAVSALFSLTGTAYHRDGFVFALPQFTIQVADQCSGIRSSLALMFTALIAGHLSLERAWAKALLVLLIVPITILKNAVRIVSLSLLATHVHPSFLVGRLHHDGGVIFFLLALALLAPLLALLRKSEAMGRLAPPDPVVSL